MDEYFIFGWTNFHIVSLAKNVYLLADFLQLLRNSSIFAQQVNRLTLNFSITPCRQQNAYPIRNHLNHNYKYEINYLIVKAEVNGEPLAKTCPLEINFLRFPIRRLCECNFRDMSQKRPRREILFRLHKSWTLKISRSLNRTVFFRHKRSFSKLASFVKSSNDAHVSAQRPCATKVAFWSARFTKAESKTRIWKKKRIFQRKQRAVKFSAGQKKFVRHSKVALENAVYGGMNI